MNRSARYPSLRERTVLITGGATGIGACFVEHFVAQGARVAFLDLDAAAGSALAQRLAAGLVDGLTAPLFVAVDLTDTAALRAAVGQVRDRFGPIGVLLNNAANDARHSIEATTPESWDAGMAVNLKHQFFATQSVIPDMKQLGGGSIINLGSISWMIKFPGMPVYTACKAAVQGLTRTLARELGPFNIRVNVLLPGAVQTEKQLRLWYDEAAIAAALAAQCLQRPLKPAHVAAMALFLASDDSAMCTAQDFIVDAGWV